MGANERRTDQEQDCLPADEGGGQPTGPSAPRWRTELACVLSTMTVVGLVDFLLGTFGLPDHTAVPEIPVPVGIGLLTVLPAAGAVHLYRVARRRTVSVYGCSNYWIGGFSGAALLLAVSERPVDELVGSALLAFGCFVAASMRCMAGALASGTTHPEPAGADGATGAAAAEAPVVPDFPSAAAAPAPEERTRIWAYLHMVGALAAVAIVIVSTLAVATEAQENDVTTVETEAPEDTTPTTEPPEPTEEADPIPMDRRDPKTCKDPAWGDGLEDDYPRARILEGAVRLRLGCPEGRAVIINNFLVVQWGSHHRRALAYFWLEKTSLAIGPELEAFMVEEYGEFDPLLIDPDWFGSFEDLACGPLKGYAFLDRKPDPLVKAVLVEIVDASGVPGYALIEREVLTWWIEELRAGILHRPDGNSRREPATAAEVEMSFDGKDQTFGAGEASADLLPTAPELRNLCAQAS